MPSTKNRYNYARLDLHITRDQERWIQEQADRAGVSRSKWAKNRILNGGRGDRQEHGETKRSSSPPSPDSASKLARKDGEGHRDDRLGNGRVGVAENLGAAIHQTLETVPDTGDRYTPSNPLDRVREVAVLSSRLLHLLNQLQPATERERELVQQVWAIASELQRKCAIAGRKERGRTTR